MKLITKIKETIKRWWKWLFIGGATIAIAATILPPDQIPEDYLIKAPKEKILISKEVDWLVPDSGGELINKGKVIRYDYISDERSTENVRFKDGDNLSNIVRIGSKQIKKDGKLFNEIKEKYYVGSPFFKSSDGSIYKVKSATTTPDAFKKQTKANFFEKMFGAYALSTSTYAGLGDGMVRARDEGSDWNSVHDLAAGDYVDTALGYIGSHRTAGSVVQIWRSFWPIDTSGLNAGITISSSTFYVYGNWDMNDDNDGDDFIRVIQSSQASHTSLVVQDVDQCGATDNPTPASFDIDFSSLASVAAWNGFDLTATTGLAYIKKTGQAANCGAAPDSNGWTCLCIREGHDVLDHDVPTAGTGNRFIGTTAEGTTDAYLLIVYTLPAAVVPKALEIIIF